MGNIFQGAVVRLRAVEPGDWETHFIWDLDTESARHSSEITPPISSVATREWAERESRRLPDHDNCRFQIENSEAELVGTLNIHNCNLRAGTFKYGIAIRPEFRRRGYAADALSIVLRYYFQERRYQKVNAEVYSFNSPSMALHERLGFVLEGRLRRMIYSGGEFHDLLIYGLTREEFDAANWSVTP